MPFDSAAEAQVAGARIGAVAEIQAIALRELHFSIPEKVVPAGLPISVVPTLSGGHQLVNDQLIYRLRAVLAVTVPDIGEILEFEATFQLQFLVPAGSSFDDRELEAFGATSVTMMAYPYIRQSFQEHCTQAGFPALVLSPLRVPLLGPEASDAAADPAT